MSSAPSRFRVRFFAVIAGVALAVTGAVGLAPSGAFASPTAPYPVSLSNYNPGNLVSDANFFDGSAMSAADVQSFLNVQVASCQAAVGGPNCLRNYTLTTTSMAADAECGAYTGASGESAATGIATVGAACGISQHVLLALIQKESGLVTATTPTTTQYDQATGWNCPDNGIGCDPTTNGFFNQVYGAAWQFKAYPLHPDLFSQFPIHQVSNVRYSTDASCGSAPVTIWNQATADLYYYTPYQPNPAALKNFFGSGDSCSSYGNRNFWGSLYNWFNVPNAGSVPTVTPIAGADRYAGSVAVSKAEFPTVPAGGVPVVYVASGENFPDALSAAPAAAVQGGPVLLAGQGSIPSEVLAEVRRLQPRWIEVVGGPNSIGQSVIDQLKAIQPNTTAVQGADRFINSQIIATSTYPSGAPTVMIASGLVFPDALSAAPAAAANHMPVLLVNGGANTIDIGTKTALTTLGTTHVYVVGGPNTVTDALMQDIHTEIPTISVERITGADRFALSDNINQMFFPHATNVYIASGLVFPDALTGAALAGHENAPLYTVNGTCLTAATAAAVLGGTPQTAQVTTFGGPNTIQPTVAGLEACPS